jgi:uncharacterized protein
MAESVRGKFLWHELMTSDTASAEDFYTKVVGWKVKAWEQDPSYKMWMTGKRGMGGLMPQRVEPGQKSPLQWFTYIGTPDVDATVRHAVELGGRVMRPAWDIPNVGRIAFLQDPQGAVFAVIAPQPSSPPPPGDQNRSLGDFSWHELITTNWQAAWDFYQKLFGWEKTSSMEMAPGQTYQMFGVSKVPLGGMYTKPPEQPGPPSWLPYAVVRDAKRTAETIKQAGGTVVMGPMEVPDGEWIVVGVDRQGASLGMHSLNPATAAKPALPKKVALAVKRVVKRAAKKLRSVKKSVKTRTSKPAKKAKPVRKPAKKAQKTKKAKRRR